MRRLRRSGLHDPVRPPRFDPRATPACRRSSPTRPARVGPRRKSRPIASVGARDQAMDERTCERRASRSKAIARVPPRRPRMPPVALRSMPGSGPSRQPLGARRIKQPPSIGSRIAKPEKSAILWVLISKLNKPDRGCAAISVAVAGWSRRRPLALRVMKRVIVGITLAALTLWPLCQGVAAVTATIGGPFALRTPDGVTVTDQTYRGSVTPSVRIVVRRR